MPTTVAPATNDAARASRLEALEGQMPATVWTLIVVMGALLVAFATLIPAALPAASCSRSCWCP